MKANAARTTGDRVKAFMGLRPGHLAPAIPKNGEPRTGLSMGESTELTAKEWDISREDQDQLAFTSHKNAAKAYAEGFHQELLVPFQGAEQDNNLRADTTLEKPETDVTVLIGVPIPAARRSRSALAP